MNKAPWLTKEILKLIKRVRTSYKKNFGEDLVNLSNSLESEITINNIIFNQMHPLLIHNIEDDPKIKYANAAALKLWKLTWDQMIGMPSKLTAPPEERKQRLEHLNKVIKNKPIKEYNGIRIDSKGTRFKINNAKIWTILDETGKNVGQAATFNSWSINK